MPFRPRTEFHARPVINQRKTVHQIWQWNVISPNMIAIPDLYPLDRLYLYYDLVDDKPLASLCLRSHIMSSILTWAHTELVLEVHYLKRKHLNNTQSDN